MSNNSEAQRRFRERNFIGLELLARGARYCVRHVTSGLIYEVIATYETGYVIATLESVKHRGSIRERKSQRRYILSPYMVERI